MTGAELQTWRKSKDLTQAQLADRLGVAEKTVCQWEQNRRKVPAWLVKRIREEQQ